MRELSSRLPLRNNRRADRVGEAIREEIATFLASSAKDPRIVGFVTVTGVELTNDLRHAKVFVSVMGTDSEKEATFDGLDSTASHLRSRVGRSLQLRVAPEIQFRQDDSVARAARIELLLAGIKSDSPADTPASPVDSGEGAGD
ncbi:MAG: 30S ribosome-binding factor RbfA [Gemmatimonadales bacterium]